MEACSEKDSGITGAYVLTIVHNFLAKDLPCGAALVLAPTLDVVIANVSDSLGSILFVIFPKNFQC